MRRIIQEFAWNMRQVLLLVLFCSCSSLGKLPQPPKYLRATVVQNVDDVIKHPLSLTVTSYDSLRRALLPSLLDTKDIWEINIEAAEIEVLDTLIIPSFKKIRLVGKPSHRNAHTALRKINLGGIFRIESGASLVLHNIDMFDGNAKDGGAIFNNGGHINIQNCSFVNHTAYSRGGCIYSKGSGAELAVINSSLTGCIAHQGGAIFAEGNRGIVSLSQVNFDRNLATEGSDLLLGDGFISHGIFFYLGQFLATIGIDVTGDRDFTNTLATFWPSKASISTKLFILAVTMVFFAILAAIRIIFYQLIVRNLGGRKTKGQFAVQMRELKDMLDLERFALIHSTSKIDRSTASVSAESLEAAILPIEEENTTSLSSILCPYLPETLKVHHRLNHHYQPLQLSDSADSVQSTDHEGNPPLLELRDFKIWGKSTGGARGAVFLASWNGRVASSASIGSVAPLRQGQKVAIKQLRINEGESPTTLLRHWRREVDFLSRVSLLNLPGDLTLSTSAFVRMRGVIVESNPFAAEGGIIIDSSSSGTKPFGLGIVFEWVSWSLRDALLGGKLQPTGFYQHRHWYARRRRTQLRRWMANRKNKASKSSSLKGILHSNYLGGVNDSDDEDGNNDNDNEDDDEHQKLQGIVRWRSDEFHRGALFTPAARRIASDICSAVALLHANRIVHRDIKASNVLLNGHGGAVLSDFGDATSFDQLESRKHKHNRAVREHLTSPAGGPYHENRALSTTCWQRVRSLSTDSWSSLEDSSSDESVISEVSDRSNGGSRADESNRRVGTLLYAAPELLKHEAHDERVDTWALAMVLVELYSGKTLLRLWQEEKQKHQQHHQDYQPSRMLGRSRDAGTGESRDKTATTLEGSGLESNPSLLAACGWTPDLRALGLQHHGRRRCADGHSERENDSGFSRLLKQCWSIKSEERPSAAAILRWLHSLSDDPRTDAEGSSVESSIFAASPTLSISSIDKTSPTSSSSPASSQSSECLSNASLAPKPLVDSHKNNSNIDTSFRLRNIVAAAVAALQPSTERSHHSIEPTPRGSALRQAESYQNKELPSSLSESDVIPLRQEMPPVAVTTQPLNCREELDPPYSDVARLLPMSISENSSIGRRHCAAVDDKKWNVPTESKDPDLQQKNSDLHGQFERKWGGWFQH